MLNTGPGQRGFTLIEVAITVSLIASLLGLLISGSVKWMQDARIRSTAESIQSGLQLARSEAVNRNARVHFQRVSSLDDSCTLSTSSGLWVISMNGAEGRCGEPALAKEATCPDDLACILQTSGMGASGQTTVIDSDTSDLVFNGLGIRSSPVPAEPVTAVNIDITGVDPARCVQVAPSDVGALRCLRVQVSPQGQIRLCDPSLSGSDPRSCPG